MSKILYFIIALLIVSCSNTSDLSNNNIVDNQDLFEFQINLTQTTSYCGGAKPTKEILNELSTPKPLPLTKVYLRKGNTNDISTPVDYEFSSDKNGIIKTQLPAGKYSVVFESKKDSTVFTELLNKYGERTSQFGPIDKDCLAEHFKKSDEVIVVGLSEQNEVTVNFVNKCKSNSVPCAKFIGQVPPSAPPSSSDN